MKRHAKPLPHPARRRPPSSAVRARIIAALPFQVGLAALLMVGPVLAGALPSPVIAGTSPLALDAALQDNGQSKGPDLWREQVVGATESDGAAPLGSERFVDGRTRDEPTEYLVGGFGDERDRVPSLAETAPLF